MLFSLKFIGKVEEKDFSGEDKYTFDNFFTSSVCIISAVYFSLYYGNWTPLCGIPSKVMCLGAVCIHKEFMWKRKDKSLMFQCKSQKVINGC